jgi:hypothetical protein
MADELFKHPEEVLPLTLNCDTYNGAKLHTLYVETMDKYRRQAAACDLIVSQLGLANDGKSIRFVLSGGRVDNSPYQVCLNFTGQNGMRASWELKVTIHPRLAERFGIQDWGGEPGSGTRLIRFRKRKDERE